MALLQISTPGNDGLMEPDRQERQSSYGSRKSRAWSRLVAPLPRDALGRRLAQLYLGLVLYGLSDSLLVVGRLGLDPWDVFQQGLARHSGIPIGTWAILVGIGVLVLWAPLHQRPGLGTLSNVVVIGSVMDVLLAVIPVPAALWLRVLTTTGGIALNGMATGCYIGAGLEAGPRDGLMVGLAARGHSLRVMRTSIEATVVVVGSVLGGNVGIGTLAYAVVIGPLAHVFIPLFAVHHDPSKGNGRNRSR